MDGSARILVASPLGRVVVPMLAEAFPDATVAAGVDRDAVHREIVGRVRFDVVIADLVWNNPDLEFTFDGLDVIDVMHEADRLAPVILATQGHSMEQDLLDEARLRPEVVSVFPKSAGTADLPALIRDAAVGKRHTVAAPSPRVPPLYELFRGRKGHTAGRLAGAIAAGRASDGATLAAAAGVAVNTATKVATHYLGPIIQQRGEHDPSLPLTLAAVYRWCGLHARYIVSWCRRNGHSSVVQP
ncbi:response regulator [Mycobacterium hubeiense]|uniref:response regulator n=1 Tax=Mycobacterium hubeiense TaxID=1867256 RepID=UPI000C7ED3E6|nr:response regulator [Mycobacterium sp. QGD 101]